MSRNNKSDETGSCLLFLIAIGFIGYLAETAVSFVKSNLYIIIATIVIILLFILYRKKQRRKKYDININKSQTGSWNPLPYNMFQENNKNVINES